ncbi:DcaP family trimeric outer membrane transporter [Reichenbachiella sp.]|uniref:DcaP family trimeric outer membrane transporter n=1 Tax=Reichenbachiella sp. TaxID=2184521 RepID=UPI003BAE912C
MKNYYKLLLLLFALAPTTLLAQEAALTDSITHQLVIPSQDLKESVLRTARERLVNDDFPGSWPMFGSDLRMKIGGYLKSDFLYDFDGTRDKSQFLMSSIPVEGQPEYGDEGYTYFLVKETRINIDVRRSNEDKIPLQLFFEGDFFTDDNRFRIRHSYITAGDFIIGQTWTTISFLESMAYMIDFAAGDALFGGRSIQVRYQKQLSDKIKVAAGLEYQPFLGIENPNNLPGKASVQLPLLALRMDYRWKTGVLFLGSSFAELRWDGGPGGPFDQTLQYDFVVAGRQYLGKNNYFTYNFSYGNASGENIIAFAGSNANAVLNAQGELEPMPAMSIMTGFMHRWTPKLESNFNYAYGWLDAPDTRAPFALKRGGIGHLNLVYIFDNNFSVATEYIWGAQRTSNDAYGNASRIQAMAKFQF